MPIRITDQERRMPRGWRDTDFNNREFEYPEDLESLTAQEREDLRTAHLRYNAGVLNPDDDVSISPSRVITPEQAARMRAEEDLLRQGENLDRIAAAHNVGDLPFEEGVGYIDDARYANGVRTLSPEEKEKVLLEQKNKKETEQRKQEIRNMNSAQWDAESRFGSL